MHNAKLFRVLILLLDSVQCTVPGQEPRHSSIKPIILHQNHSKSKNSTCSSCRDVFTTSSNFNHIFKCSPRITVNILRGGVGFCQTRRSRTTVGKSSRSSSRGLLRQFRHEMDHSDCVHALRLCLGSFTTQIQSDKVLFPQFSPNWLIFLCPNVP
jgi:hypothetical protein